MNKYPCKNCLKYPICISKEEIACYDFYRYALDISVRYKEEDYPEYRSNTDMYWKHLRTIIPNISRLTSYKESV